MVFYPRNCPPADPAGPAPSPPMSWPHRLAPLPSPGRSGPVPPRRPVPAPRRLRLGPVRPGSGEWPIVTPPRPRPPAPRSRPEFDRPSPARATARGPMGCCLSAYATSAGRGRASWAVRLNRRWSAGAGALRCACCECWGWDESARQLTGQPTAALSQCDSRRLRQGPQEAARGVNALGAQPGLHGPEEPELRRRGECSACGGSGAAVLAAGPPRAAGLGPRAARDWGRDAAGLEAPAPRRGRRARRRGCARWRCGLWGRLAAYVRRARGVREAGEVAPGPKGPRELGEPQPGRPRCSGEEGCAGSLPALWGRGDLGDWQLSLARLWRRRWEETEPCGFGNPHWGGGLLRGVRRNWGCEMGRLWYLFRPRPVVMGRGWILLFWGWELKVYFP